MKKFLLLFSTIILSLFMAFGCSTDKSASYKSANLSVPVTDIKTNVTDSKIDLFLNIAGKDTYQIKAYVVPGNATDSSLSYSVTSGGENITLSDSGLVTAVKEGVAYITIKSNSNPNILKEITVNITSSNVSGGDIDDIGKDIKWDKLPQNPITGDTTTFNEEIPTPKTPVTKDNLLSLIGHYRIAYMTVAGPNGNPVVIDNVVGSGNNMRGEFAVNVEACDITTNSLCKAGLAIKMQFKSQFHHSLVTQGVPESLRYIKKNIYSYLQTMDVSKIGDEFARLGAVINDDGTVTFTLNNTQVPIPQSYTMTIKLIKIADDSLASSKIVLDDIRYFSDGGISNVSSVSILNKDISVEIGKTSQIKYQITPVDATNKNVTFTSDNDQIATVDSNGVVSGVNIGQATITIKTEDNGKTDTAVINVVDKIINVQSLNVSSESVTLDLNLANPTNNKDVTFEVVPSNATDKSLEIESISQEGFVQAIIKINTLSIVGLKTTTSPIEIVVVSQNNKNAKATINVTVVDNTVHVSRVYFTETEKRVKVGNEPFTITANVEPTNAFNKTVTYSSNNVSVATVDANTGKVTIISDGEATITATAIDGGLTGTYKVIVSKSDVDVKSISITPNNLTILDNDKTPKKLTVVYEPVNATINKAVTFKADTDEFITLDEQTGSIIAKKAGGPTTITATTENGKTATATVTVSSSVVNVTNVTINNKDTINKELKKDATVTLSYTVAPDNATNNSVVFEVKDNSDVLEVNQSGVVTAKKSGSATIIVKSSENNSIKDEITFTVWEQLDISGTYNVNSINLTLNGTTITSGSISTHYHENKISFTMSTSTTNGLIIKAKYQLAWGHFANNPQWDVFRFNYIDYNTTLTEREMSKDKYIEKHITVNDDGTIKVGFPFNFEGNKLVYNKDSNNKVEFILSSTDKTDYNNSINNDKFISVIPVNFNDPYSLTGAYDMLTFEQKNNVGVNIGAKYSYKKGGGIFGGGTTTPTLERLIGEVSTTVNTTNKTIDMVSKVQMNSQQLKDGKFGFELADQQFQVTNYQQVTYNLDTLRNDRSFGVGNAKNSGKVTPNNEQWEGKTSDIKIYSTFDESIATVEVSVFAKKKSDTPITLNGNTAYYCDGAFYKGSASCPDPEPLTSEGIVTQLWK